MTGTFSVRQATAFDIPTLAYHRAAMFRDMGSLPEHLFDPLVEATRSYFTGAVQSGEYVGWVATAETGEVVAGAGLQLRRILPRPDPSGREIILSPEAIVLNVYTEPSWRRRGAAQQLMQHVLAWTARNGVKSVVLHAAADARPLYEKLGFEGTNEMRLARGPSHPLTP